MVDGGAVSNAFLMQFQADILNIPILKPANIESTSLGISYLAGLQTGIWNSSEELLAMHKVQSTYKPAMEPETREKFLNGWQKALRQTMTL